jgi:hypothetical protein
MAYERCFETDRGLTVHVSTGSPTRFTDVDQGRVGRVRVLLDTMGDMSYEDATRLGNALLEIAATARHHSKG